MFNSLFALASPTREGEGVPLSPPTSSTLSNLEIQDTGIGIAPKEIDILLQAFGHTETGRQS